MEQTMERRWHEVWREQCEAAETIRLRHGVGSAFDYAIGEKLLSFAEAAEEHPEFARALPQFVSELRRMFTPEEIEEHLARIENERLQRTMDTVPHSLSSRSSFSASEMLPGNSSGGSSRIAVLAPLPGFNSPFLTSRSRIRSSHCAAGGTSRATTAPRS